MNQYYLIAQLPSLDCVNETTPLPITEERFYELCERFLGKKALRVLKEDLTLLPAREKSKRRGNKLVDRWTDAERQLRLALATVRAGKMKKTFEAEGAEFPAEMLEAARNAVEMDDPMQAEIYLNRFRLSYLEDLRPADPFSENMLFYYGLKLKIILRIQQFDENVGRNAYRNIYDSIMYGDEQEVKE